MKDIICFVFLGAIAGLISGFWHRITEPDMLLGFLRAWFYKKDSNHILRTGRRSWWHVLITCLYCFSVWIFGLLSIYYILEYNPWWVNVLIGVPAGLGASNFVCETIDMYQKI